ncbi:GFA family protein [Antarctobacter sp.]|uniref:GFA family protein n=1 Tax=Antarctobacter sp. TaxID=1872577 RepID=UPI002B27827E|nr:GFA family protein [Antarctobacter sp.]
MYQNPNHLTEENTLEEAAYCQGGCGCGAVRYRVTSVPLIVHACHCRLCQRQTGSTNAVNALIEADRVIVLSGTVEESLLDTPSGRGQRIARCTSCKVALWSNYLITNQGDHMRFLRVGTLDDPALMSPDIHIYTSTKLPWYALARDVPAIDTIYERKGTWSEQSMKRLKALCKKSGAPFK